MPNMNESKNYKKLRADLICIWNGEYSSKIHMYFISSMHILEEHAALYRQHQKRQCNAMRTGGKDIENVPTQLIAQSFYNASHASIFCILGK